MITLKSNHSKKKKSKHNKLVVKTVINYSISHTGKMDRNGIKLNLEKTPMTSKTNVANNLIITYTSRRVFK